MKILISCSQKLEQKFVMLAVNLFQVSNSFNMKIIAIVILKCFVTRFITSHIVKLHSQSLCSTCRRSIVVGSLYSSDRATLTISVLSVYLQSRKSANAQQAVQWYALGASRLWDGYSFCKYILGISESSYKWIVMQYPIIIAFS